MGDCGLRRARCHLHKDIASPRLGRENRRIGLAKLVIAASRGSRVCGVSGAWVGSGYGIRLAY